ncbi:MAG: hypothetical protein LBN30_04860, partial [Oscillospiraceae bacterium]|nr:hypothetical protein [Oscillospiraceae bacterium]
MKILKRIISIALTLAVAMSLLAGVASAAGTFATGYTLDEALTKLGVSFRGDPLDWLTIHGKVKSQNYTFYPLKSAITGQVEESPVYCIDPDNGGIKEGVEKLGIGNKIMTYYRGEKVGNATYISIL